MHTYMYMHTRTVDLKIFVLQNLYMYNRLIVNMHFIFMIDIDFENTVESPPTDSPYYGNLNNADKSPRSQIIPYI